MKSYKKSFNSINILNFSYEDSKYQTVMIYKVSLIF